MLYADPALITGFVLAAALFGGAWALAWRAEVAAQRRLAAQPVPQPVRFAVVQSNRATDAPYLENCGMMARAA